MLSDEQIKAAVLKTTNDMLDHIYENGTGSEFVLRSMMKAARTVEAAACAERDQRIAELEKANAAFFQRQDWWNRRMVELEQELEAVRKDAERKHNALKEAGLFLHHAWCDVQMNEYSFERLNRAIEIVDAAIDAAKERT